MTYNYPFFSQKKFESYNIYSIYIYRIVHVKSMNIASWRKYVFKLAVNFVILIRIRILVES